MNLQIKECAIDQLDEIEQLYRICGQDMLEKGFDNWGDFYPPRATIEADLSNNTLWGLFLEEQLLAVIVLNAVQPTPFTTVHWQFEIEPVLVVHRLAVKVAHQGNGYAKKLMLFAEKYAQEHNYGTIRLDAYSINSQLLKFYEQLGYQRTKEAIYLGAKWAHAFICFEKMLADE